MPKLAIILLFVLGVPPVLFAQQNSPSAGLNGTQEEGRRLYQQRCGVCHTPPTQTSKSFGPVLYKNLIAGNEDAMQAYIKNGSKKMPGFKYELQPSQITAIVEYLKVVPKPSSSGSTGPAENSGDL